MFLEIQSGDDRLLEIIKKKSQPYFDRGMSAVIEGHPLRTFDDTVDIIKPKLFEHGLDEDFAEAFACTFARSYIAGIVAAVRLVAPDLVALYEPCLGEVSV